MQSKRVNAELLTVANYCPNQTQHWCSFEQVL